MTGAACAFLDRDGTIIEERHYLGEPDGVAIEAGAAAGLRALAAHGYRLVVVSNQSGIARGRISPGEVDAVNARLDALLRAQGVVIDGWYVCPHGPQEGCRCRKPAPGLIDRAAADLAIDLPRSVLIGDKASDLGAARARAVPGHLVLTGHGAEHADWARANGFAVHASLRRAAESIVAEGGRLVGCGR